MRDLQKYFEMAIAEMDAIDIPYGNIVEVTPNNRAKKRWGQCRKRGAKYYINISTRLLDESVPEKSLMTVLIHEILHTCPNCMEHKNDWKRYADLVNDCYNYNVKRCDSAKEYGVKPIPPKVPKYTVTCQMCGRKYNYNRKTRWMDDLDRYDVRCSRCKSVRLIVVQNR